MRLILRDNKVASSVRTVITMICLFFNLLICCYHIYRIRNSKDAQFNLMTKLSITCICCCVFYGIAQSLFVFSIWPHTVPCKWQMAFAVYFYVFSKLSLYVFQIERMFYIVKSSIYAFTTKQIKLTRLFLLLSLLMFVILVAIFQEGEFIDGICWQIRPWFIDAMAVVFDIGYMTTIWVLLSRRMLLIYRTGKLNRQGVASNSVTHKAASKTTTKEVDVITLEETDTDHVQNHDHQETDTEHETMFVVLRKVFTLTLVALITSNFALITGIMIGLPAMWTAIDSVVNALLHCICCCVFRERILFFVNILLTNLYITEAAFRYKMRIVV
eukprot:644139_1